MSFTATTNLPLATGHGDVDEAAGVSEPLLRAALGGLLLLLGLNLFPQCQPPCLSQLVLSSCSAAHRRNDHRFFVLRSERGNSVDADVLTLAARC